jgi:hypothetical protein
MRCAALIWLTCLCLAGCDPQTPDAPPALDPGPPPLTDAKRFAPVTWEQLEFNRAYRQCLEGRLAFERHRHLALEEAIAETDRLHQLHLLLYWAQSECGSAEWRRDCLKELRAALGVQAYYGGRLPAVVPTQHFQRR